MISGVSPASGSVRFSFPEPPVVSVLYSTTSSVTTSSVVVDYSVVWVPYSSAIVSVASLLSIVVS